MRCCTAAPRNTMTRKKLTCSLTKCMLQLCQKQPASTPDPKLRPQRLDSHSCASNVTMAVGASGASPAQSPRKGILQGDLNREQSGFGLDFFFGGPARRYQKGKSAKNSSALAEGLGSCQDRTGECLGCSSSRFWLQGPCFTRSFS